MIFCKRLTPYYQIIISCFWMDLDPTFEILSFPHSCLLEDIDVIFKMSKEFIRQIFGNVRPTPFRNWTTISKTLLFCKNYVFEIIQVFLDIIGVIWCLLRQIIWVWGVMVPPARSENHDNLSFSDLPNMKSKSY